MLKSFITLTIVLTFLSIVLLSGCKGNDNKVELSQDELIAKGKYLVQQGGCNDCHSPKVMTQMGPVPDTTKLLSGHPAGSVLAPIDTASVTPGRWYLASSDLTAWVGPWGISYTANLTPDDPTGTGTWTDEIFIKALRTGKHMGAGRQILPPMPWQDIGKSTDDDLKAIFAYLKSLPAIRNQVPDPVPPDQISAMK